MARTILIPTDFTVTSLNIAKIAMQKSCEHHEKINLILLHGLMASTSITELLFYSKRKVLDKLETPEFHASCKLLLAKFEDKIERMTVDIFSGINQSAFENYTSANRVDEAFIPVNNKLKLKNSDSFDMIPFFRKSKLKITEVKWEDFSLDVQKEYQDQLSAMFFTHGRIAH
ncbi:hypothetical protein GCM10009119_24360 [Algoriphagus jejuensis]|uniref:Universal stress protein family protein n=1 Tax=Algoriphagus jejuensis TaxID=419934 RepID=A0ABP3YEF6_9BACT